MILHSRVFGFETAAYYQQVRGFGGPENTWNGWNRRKRKMHYEMFVFLAKKKCAILRTTPEFRGAASPM